MLTYTTPDGKQWEVVDVRKPNADHLIVMASGAVGFAEPWHAAAFYPIVRPIIPEWITPTDEHAKQRPMVEVRNCETEDWGERKLLAVTQSTQPFVAAMSDLSLAYNWRYCRMRNPEYKEQS